MAGIFGFLRSFGKEKLNQMGESVTQKIVSWDPETASQAEIEEMIKDLDKITTEAGKAKSFYEKERAEAETARKNYDRYLSAAELLNKQLEIAQATGDDQRSKELGSSLEKLLKDLEKIQPEMDRETQEAEEARTYYEEVKQLAEVTAEKVKSARAQLEKAKRDMKRAEIEQQRAKARAEKAENMAGLKKQSSSLGVALSAMNKQAEEARASASASDMKAKLLSTPGEKEDENISAALKEVSGEKPVGQSSFADRLTVLRNK